METYAAVFSALGDENRLRVMSLFVRSHQALCVSELVDSLDLPQYLISRQLRKLHQAHILKFRKRGTWSYYYLNEDPPFNKFLFRFLEQSLADDQFENDSEALQIRLSYREKGRCVIRTVPHDEIRNKIQSLSDET